MNFQFDTTFMFIGIVLMYLTIFQKRNPEKLPGPPTIYMLYLLSQLWSYLCYLIKNTLIKLTHTQANVQNQLYIRLKMRVMKKLVPFNINKEDYSNAQCH